MRSWRWLKFNLVGGLGIVVQLGALALFRSFLHLDYLVGTGLAVELAVLHNFLWHERFTWHDRPSVGLWHSLARLVRFNGSNGALSLVGNLLIMRGLVGAFRLNYVVSNLAAVVVCSVVNFLLSDRWVFEDKRGQDRLVATIQGTTEHDASGFLGRRGPSLRDF